MSYSLFIALCTIAGLLAPGPSVAQAFRCQPEAPHHVILLLEGKTIDLPEMRGKVRRWLWDAFPERGLRLRHLRIASHHVLLVESFADRQEAVSFIRQLQDRRPDFMHMGLVWAVWAVSADNWRRIVRADSFRGYPEFYSTCYP